MANEFGTLLEDQSEREVARSLCQLFAESIKGDTRTLETLRLTSTRKNNNILASVEVSNNAEEHALSSQESDNELDT